MVWTALLVSLLAGLATSVGALLATHKKVLQRPILAFAMAFSAGAMLFVSFVEILPLGMNALTKLFNGDVASSILYGSFFVGIGLVALIDRFLPRSLNPSELEGQEESLTPADNKVNKKLLRSGFLVAVVLALHNFPEGMSTFFATYQDISIGLTLAVAIAIHNIPEGIAVAAPIFAATKSRKKAFWWATLSGLAEPIGAVIGFALLSLFVPEQLFGVLFGLVAGMMVFIAVDELLPAAKRYQTRVHQGVYGLLAGMFVVALSLIML